MAINENSLELIRSWDEDRPLDVEEAKDDETRQLQVSIGIIFEIAGDTASKDATTQVQITFGLFSCNMLGI